MNRRKTDEKIASIIYWLFGFLSKFILLIFGNSLTKSSTKEKIEK